MALCLPQFLDMADKNLSNHIALKITIIFVAWILPYAIGGIPFLKFFHQDQTENLLKHGFDINGIDYNVEA